MSTFRLSPLLMVVSASSLSAQTPNCPRAADGSLTFPNTLVMSTGLAVNPDGAAASYTPGDHGYTYITNGVNMIVAGQKVPCSIKQNSTLCRDAWIGAEKDGFGPGTSEFCSFAIAVAPVSAGTSPQNCEGRRDRWIIGNGKGRPAPGQTLRNVEGQEVVAYQSITALRHTIAGNEAYFDSSTLPGIVVPQARSDLIGSIAWVRFGSRSTFAIVNDTGPAYGEGTIALYQALFYDTARSRQAVGPIPLALRCTSVEKLEPPFVSKPDKKGDGCKRGHKAQTQSDIRAYMGIETGLQTVILTSVKPPMSGRQAKIELTPASMEALAASAGYDRARLSAMADCLSK